MSASMQTCYSSVFAVPGASVRGTEYHRREGKSVKTPLGAEMEVVPYWTLLFAIDQLPFGIDENCSHLKSFCDLTSPSEVLSTVQTSW